MLNRLYPLSLLGEGDAYGASLRQISSRPRAKVTLRASTCVDCHVIKLKDLHDVLLSYPADLRTQLLETMDAAHQNDLYDEVVQSYLSRFPFPLVFAAFYNLTKPIIDS